MHKFTLKDAIAKHVDGDLAGAAKLYKVLIERYPTAFEPCFYMASILTQQNDVVTALAWLHRALELEPESPVICNNLGSLYRRTNQTEMAQKYLMRGLEKPMHLEADLCNNVGTTFVNEGNPLDGESYLRRAIEVNPDHPQAHWNLGLILLETRRWKEGWQCYHRGTFTAERTGRWSTWPDWKGNKERVAIYGEQGLGDEVMFSSCIHDAIDTGADITLECHPRLKQTFERTFPEVKVLPTRKDMIVDDMPEFDSKMAMGDLGMLYRNSVEEFPRKPFLKMDQELTAETLKGYEQFPKPWIGIGWKGGYNKTRKDLRSLPLEEWLPILKAGKGTFFSFQYDLQADNDIEAFCSKYPNVALHHFPNIVRADNYDIILHHLNCMDCVIHVCGTGVHACGSLGVPCYCLTPSRPAWRYGIEGDDMPFYGENVIQIRQDGDDWKPLIRTVATKVRNNDFPKRLEYGF